MVHDQSVNDTYKNHIGGLYEAFNNRKPLRQMNAGFINDIKSSFEDLSLEKVEITLIFNQKIIRMIITANSAHTN